jgi:LAO/AO transport system kinase
MRPGVPASELARLVRSGHRATIAQVITLIESTRAEDRAFGRTILKALAPVPTHTLRLGIGGAPGVGKSSLIERLGLEYIRAGHRVGVIAVDPSSMQHGGSILGDKTRMNHLARESNAFIRPSPSAGATGGITRGLRESIMVLEAANFDVILVETVGSGQNEFQVAHTVDFLLVLVQPGSGDGLQGIKRGILEWAEAVVLTKADGGNKEAAEQTARAYASALRLFSGTPKPVIVTSSQDGTGLDRLREAMNARQTALTDSGEWSERRASQQTQWMWHYAEQLLLHRLKHFASEDSSTGALQERVKRGDLSPESGAKMLLKRLFSTRSTSPAEEP